MGLAIYMHWALEETFRSSESLEFMNSKR